MPIVREDMATLKQYFDTDFNRILSAHQPFLFQSKFESAEVICRIHYDFDANVTFVSYYVPTLKNLVPLCIQLIEDLNWSTKMARDHPVQFQRPGDEQMTSTDLGFSGRIYLYCEAELAKEDLKLVKKYGSQLGRSVHFRGPKYTMERSKIEKPLAFISHDLRDKDEIARPLALQLQIMMCPVWYDEYSLKLGNSLRQSIEIGLKECKKCILILTPNFLSNTGWTKTEFNSIFTREILERTNVVLPIWHQVTAREVYEYCPSLADRIAIEWSRGINEISRQIYRSVTS